MSTALATKPVVTRDARQAAEALDRASIMVGGGWCQNAMARRSDGSSCGWGDADCVAVDAFAAIRSANREKTAGVLEQATEAVSAFAGQGINIWNDAPGRTQAEVVAGLHAAAGILRGEA